MLLEVPFYENNGDGFQCVQVAMQCVLKKYLGKEYSLAELDRLTGRNKGQMTWISQMVPVLYDLGLDVKYYAKIPQEPFLEGEAYIRREYGDAADKILSLTDVHVMQKAVRRLLDKHIFVQSVLTQQQIEGYLLKGFPLLVTVDNEIMHGRHGIYHGHFVVLTGFDEHSYYFHESGPLNPAPNKRVAKDLFFRAWNANGTDNDVVVVYGRRA